MMTSLTSLSAVSDALTMSLSCRCSAEDWAVSRME